MPGSQAIRLLSIAMMSTPLVAGTASGSFEICPEENMVSEHVLQEVDKKISLHNDRDGITFYVPAKCAGNGLSAIEASFYIGDALIFSTYLDKRLSESGEIYAVAVDKGHKDLQVSLAAIYMGSEYSCGCLFERGPIPVGTD